jgi:hypothetical protein
MAVGAMALSFVLTAAVIFIPPFAAAFGFETISLMEYAVANGAGPVGDSDGGADQAGAAQNRPVNCVCKRRKERRIYTGRVGHARHKNGCFDRML